MPGRLNRSCAADGVLAYQDTEQENTFHYFPARIDAVQGETLLSYNVKYYGINAEPYFVDLGNRNYQSVVGTLVSGQAVADITSSQRAAITAEIKRVFKMAKGDEVNLVPLVMQSVTVQPITSKMLINMGSGGESTFPERFQLGTQFGFNIASGNSLFATIVGNQGSLDQQNSPDIGLNFYGTTELRADKWVARIEADLSQVWSYTRDKIGGGLSLGWFNLTGFDYDKIVQDLTKNNIIKVTFIEGGGGKEFGFALLESTKTVFEAINAQIASGDGLFKFEPNPVPKEPPPAKDSLGADLLPWRVSLNMSFGRQTFSQSIKYEQTVEFEGNVVVPFNGNMSLAQVCNRQTETNFFDLQLGKNGCITPAKSDGLQQRMKRETALKDAKVKEYYAKVEQGIWTPSQLRDMLALLNTTTLSESAVAVRQPDGSYAPQRVPEKEAIATLESMVELLTATPEHPAATATPLPWQVGTVFPPDGRRRIADTSKAPWNAIGQIEATFPNGKLGYGTGTLLNSNCVITAAHVLYNSKMGGYATRVRFAPARNGAYDPHGIFDGDGYLIPDDFPENERSVANDYGILFLEKAVPDGFAAYRLRNAGTDALRELVVEVAGYPGDKPPHTMWSAGGMLSEVHSSALGYRISTFEGQSGSALSYFGGQSYDIVGIHVGGNDNANYACRVTDKVLQTVRAWIQEKYPMQVESAAECK